MYSAPCQVRRSMTRQAAPEAIPSAAAFLRSAETALMRCSAALQGTIFSSQVPGPTFEKSVCSASGTAVTLIIRSSRQKGTPCGKMRAGQFQNRGIGGKRHGRAIFLARRAQPSFIKTVAINETERLHLPLDIVDFQHGGLRMGLANEGAETLAVFQSGRVVPVRQEPCSPSYANSHIAGSSRVRRGYDIPAAIRPT